MALAVGVLEDSLSRSRFHPDFLFPLGTFPCLRLIACCCKAPDVSRAPAIETASAEMRGLETRKAIRGSHPSGCAATYI